MTGLTAPRRDPRAAAEHDPSEVATFCFVDMAGFTALTEAHGDQTAVTLVRRFVRLTQNSLAGHGNLLKTIGDAVLLRFESPDQALDAVSELLLAASYEPGFPQLRAGLHRGPVTPVGGDYLGTTVNIAARVAGVARSGQVLLTQPAVPRPCRQRLTNAGPVAVRNVREPLDLYELIWSDDVSLVDPVCRMRLDPTVPAERLWHAGREYLFCSLACTAAFAVDPDYYAPPATVGGVDA